MNAPSEPALSMQDLLQRQRDAHMREPVPSADVRRERLARLLAMVRANADSIATAISEDFGHRSRAETFVTEFVAFQERIAHSRRKLSRWMRMRRLPTSFMFLPATNRMLPQPLGVVGILSPWNYPLDLSLGPAIDALAAGNRVMLKPSEFSPRYSALLADLVARHFDAAELTVVVGGVEVAAAFSALPFDHLVFTGSTAVGRRVAQAAAANLTPVTLELGGKSPAIIDPGCDLAAAAPRIAWGKLVNAGQTCVAPDYLLVPRDRQDEAVGALKTAMRQLYPTFLDNPDYTSIVSERHRERLLALVEDARRQGAGVIEFEPPNPEHGGRKLAPVILTGVNDTMQVMREEIFGPILPVVTYGKFDEALAYVNAHDRPLALYWFGSDSRRRDQVLRGTISGGVGINECLVHVTQGSQPFGGVGPSGQGAYHGEWGFNTFSKLKPVFVQSRLNGMGLIRPPYGTLIERGLAWFRR